MTTHQAHHIDIFALIDQQRGFSRYDLPQEEGGCLYVPGGEATAEPAARLIDALRGGVVLLSQDNHPENHISFMENHPGVVAWRKAKLRAAGIAEAELDARILDPLTLPFDAILLKTLDGRARAVAFQDGATLRAVATDADGHITAVRDEPADPALVAGALAQTLWRKHCVQGSVSALPDAAVLAALPPDLADAIRTQPRAEALRGADERGNDYFVVRKGMRADMDSYGIATENDGVSLTKAPQVFAEIADALQARGATGATIYLGGLATNFCVEFSHADLRRYLVPALEARGIATKMILLTDVSAGIPLAIPGGAWPDLAAAPQRFALLGTTASDSDGAIRAAMAQRVGAKLEPRPAP